MTDLIPEVLKGHKPHAASVEQMVALKSQKVKRRRRTQKDTVAQRKRELKALQKKETSVVDDPLANLPAAKEQPTDSGEYYPIGMSAIFYLLAAAQADLKSGNKLATIENGVMKDQFESWAAEAIDYANQAKHSLKLEATTQMWNGIGSAVSAGVSLGSFAGSLYTMRSFSSKIKGLQDEKTILQSKRLDQPSIEVNKANSSAPKLVAVASGKVSNPDEIEMEDFSNSFGVNADEPSALSDEAQSAVEAPIDVEADIQAKRDLPNFDDDQEPLTLKEDRLLKSQMNLEESRRGALARNDTSAVKQYDSAIDTVKADRERVKLKDNYYKSRVEDTENAIKRKEKEEQSWQNNFQAINNMAQGANGVITGFTSFSFTTQRADTEYQKAMSDVKKQFGQTLAQSYNSAIETVYRAIDQELSSIESTMKALYAAQSAGAA